jgi:hypothetical protein
MANKLAHWSNGRAYLPGGCITPVNKVQHFVKVQGDELTGGVDGQSLLNRDFGLDLVALETRECAPERVIEV